MNPENTLPPPLPDVTELRDELVRIPARFRSRPMVLAAALTAAAAADCSFFSNPSAGWGGYGFAAGTVLMIGAVAAMRRDLSWKSPALWLLLPVVVASAWIGGAMSIFLAPILLGLWSLSGPVESDTRFAGRAPGIFEWWRALVDALTACCRRVFPGRMGAWLAGVGVMAGFLLLLSSGNLALSKYLEGLADMLRDLIRIRAEDVVRVVLWVFAVAALGLFAAVRRRRVTETFTTPVTRPVPVPVAMLVGANLAFLASNLADTFWIGFEHRAPDGVALTEYLHSGTYALMADAAVATLLLLVIFRNGASSRVSRFATLAGITLVVQCAWLGLGVAGRVAMQIDRFGFTANRIWIVVLLVWGYAGLIAAWRFLRRRPSIREFVRHALWSGVAIASLVQFRPPAILSVDLNIAGMPAHPDWKPDEAYLFYVGDDAVRLLEARGASKEEIRKALERNALESDRCYPATSAGWRPRSIHGDALNVRIAPYFTANEKTSP